MCQRTGQRCALWLSSRPLSSPADWRFKRQRHPRGLFKRGSNRRDLRRTTALSHTRARRATRARRGSVDDGARPGRRARHVAQAQVLDRLGLAGDEFAERIFARSGVEAVISELNRISRAHAPGPHRGRRGPAAGTRHRCRRPAAARPRADRHRREREPLLDRLPDARDRLVDHYGMRRHRQVPRDGRGLRERVPLLRLAAQTLHADPERDALVVAAESMSGTLIGATPEDPKAKTVGCAIFGDGCAAAVLSRDAGHSGPAIVDSEVAPDRRNPSRRGPGAVAGGQLPAPRVRAARPRGGRSGGLVDASSRAASFRRADRPLDRSPGGRRIVECADALALSDDDVAVSWQSLADHGNVGRTIDLLRAREHHRPTQPAPGERGLAITIGTGVTVGMMLLLLASATIVSAVCTPPRSCPSSAWSSPSSTVGEPRGPLRARLARAMIGDVLDALEL